MVHKIKEWYKNTGIVQKQYRNSTGNIGVVQQ